MLLYAERKVITMLRYPTTQSIPVKIDINGFDHMDRDSKNAIIDNSQCTAYIVFWMSTKGHSSNNGYEIIVNDVAPGKWSIRVYYLTYCFFAMHNDDNNTWHITRLGDPTIACNFASNAYKLGCELPD